MKFVWLMTVMVALIPSASQAGGMPANWDKLEPEPASLTPIVAPQHWPTPEQEQDAEANLSQAMKPARDLVSRPRKVSGMMQCAEDVLELGHKEAAQDLYQELLAANNVDHITLLNIALFFSKEGDYLVANKIYHRILDSNPPHTVEAPVRQAIADIERYLAIQNQPGI